MDSIFTNLNSKKSMKKRRKMIQVQATAGLRLLPHHHSEALIGSVKTLLETSGKYYIKY
jgi:hypothetical protein